MPPGSRYRAIVTRPEDCSGEDTLAEVQRQGEPATEQVCRGSGASSCEIGSSQHARQMGAAGGVHAGESLLGWFASEPTSESEMRSQAQRRGPSRRPESDSGSRHPGAGVSTPAERAVRCVPRTRSGLERSRRGRARGEPKSRSSTMPGGFTTVMRSEVAGHRPEVHTTVPDRRPKALTTAAKRHVVVDSSVVPVVTNHQTSTKTSTLTRHVDVDRSEAVRERLTPTSTSVSARRPRFAVQRSTCKVEGGVEDHGRACGGRRMPGPRDPGRPGRSRIQAAVPRRSSEVVSRGDPPGAVPRARDRAAGGDSTVGVRGRPPCAAAPRCPASDSVAARTIEHGTPHGATGLSEFSRSTVCATCADRAA